MCRFVPVVGARPPRVMLGVGRHHRELTDSLTLPSLREVLVCILVKLRGMNRANLALRLAGDAELDCESGRQYTLRIAGRSGGPAGSEAPT